METKGTLTFFCGKMGAGKTSMSVDISRENNAVLLSEDDWLTQTYPNQITNFDEYLKFSRQIKPLVKKLAQSILLTGTNVVMDFPANTVSQRDWFKTLVSEIDAPHKMIYLETSNEICLRHIAKRKVEQPERASFDTEEVFLQVTQYFEEPGETEEINVRKIEVCI
jgi:predicted kinase